MIIPEFQACSTIQNKIPWQSFYHFMLLFLFTRFSGILMIPRDEVFQALFDCLKTKEILITCVTQEYCCCFLTVGVAVAYVTGWLLIPLPQ